MSEALDQEIQTLQSIYWSERDPDGLAFAPLADALQRNGQVRQALDLLKDGMSRHPDFTTGHVVAARLYYDKGMHAEAEISARRVLELDPDNLVALSLLGGALGERGEWAEAAGLHERLERLDPESEETLAALGLPSASQEASVEAMGLAGEPAPAEGAAEMETVEPSPELAAALDALGLDPDEDRPVPIVDDLVEDSPLEALELEPAAEPLDIDSALDLSGLAPDAEPEADALDLSALAPDAEPEADELDLSALAPDPEPEADAMDLSALAPDPEPEADAMDLSALAPDPEPDDAVLDLHARAPDFSTDEATEMDASEPVHTRTLAELYIRQGFKAEALEVYRSLLEQNPSAKDLRTRIRELEAELGLDDEEVEALARDIAGLGDAAHDVDTPFAWTEDHGPRRVRRGEKGGIGDYFDGLLSWGSDGE